MPRAKDEENSSELVSPGITIPKDLLERFDKWWPGKFASRSDAIREGIRILLNGTRKVRQPVAAEVPQQ